MRETTCSTHIPSHPTSPCVVVKRPAPTASIAAASHRLVAPGFGRISAPLPLFATGPPVPAPAPPYAAASPRSTKTRPVGGHHGRPGWTEPAGRPTRPPP